MARSRNPFKFLPVQVTVVCSLVYISLFAALLIVHHRIPPAPSSSHPIDGIDLAQAWRDLEFISDGFHPWGSRRNEVVKKYLLNRIHEEVESNGVDVKTVYATDNGFWSTSHKPAPVTVFANDTSNFTAADDWTLKPWTLHGESDNLLVYIRGEEDADGDWWNETLPYEGTSGVLVNAHYDSVASGLGATDDGVGCVTILQLISHFTSKGNRPRRGIVALLNNGEENGLYGARSYLRHPLSQMPHVFLNLEGAGAGGRAMLFRSTDAEVTKAYSTSPYPFGTVVSGDGFKRGFIRSGTDYTVFTEELGLRGLDVAFYTPRSRYHTDQDDSRNTSPASLWNMLSASLATVQALASHKGDDFEGSPDKTGKLGTGSGSLAFWFDLFGVSFAVGQLNTLFALSVTLLVAGPLILILTEVILRKSDKWYPMKGKQYLHSSDDDECARLHGRRGVVRFVLAFAAATAVTVALAFLITKQNPYIVYSSEYAVWVMMLTAWFVVAWFFLTGAHNIRPTALQRMYVLLWLYVLTWVLLVLTTVGENNLHLASGYFFVIYNASVFVALLISYLELSALPTIHKYVEHVLGAQVDTVSLRRGSQSSRDLLRDDVNEEHEATERTSLLRGATKHSDQQTFTGLSRRRADRDEVPEETTDPYLNRSHEDEQAWSSSLPQWTWILQLLVLVPINVIVVGQIALMLTAALHQTPADGNPVLPTYLFLAALTVLLLLPLTPFLHRFKYHVPTFLVLVFIGCLIYNLIAFPFSREARMKYYFVQHVDLESGANNVSLTGLDGYIQDIIAQMPSAAGQRLHCGQPSTINRQGLTSCTWQSLAPHVVPHEDLNALKKNSTRRPTTKDWLTINTTAHGSTASLSLKGLNTKICRLTFDNAVSHVSIEGATSDPRQKVVSEGGSTEIHLFSRTWEKLHRVNVTWDDTSAKGQTGKAWCSWSDANQPGAMPAFDEVRRFEPVWSAVTKMADGLVEGWKSFEI